MGGPAGGTSPPSPPGRVWAPLRASSSSVAGAGTGSEPCGPLTSPAPSGSGEQDSSSTSRRRPPPPRQTAEPRPSLLAVGRRQGRRADQSLHVRQRTRLLPLAHPHLRLQG